MADIVQQTIDVSNNFAIDEILKSNDFKAILQEIKKQYQKLDQGLRVYENKKKIDPTIYSLENNVQSINIIRQALKQEGVELTNLGLEGYYTIERLKEWITKTSFSYTIGTVSKEKGRVVLHRAEKISLKELMFLLSKNFQRTASSNNAEAILTGRVTLKKMSELETGINNQQALLFAKMWNYAQQINLKNKGIVFEAFEYALFKGLDKVKNIYKIHNSTLNKCFIAASGNVPFFTYHGDVNGVQVKFGGFTLARINTIRDALYYYYILIIAIMKGNINLQKEIEKYIMKGTDAKTIALKMEEIVANIADQEILDLISDLKTSKIQIDTT